MDKAERYRYGNVCFMGILMYVQATIVRRRSL